ncbi:MAG: 3'-5' exonuclease domain-containing protein 2 [Prevotellaceae bacterium]|jgi:ribonuclease D|nr:3'-5' exonuclease domain-containing protein 2 [Prevotellaceae bacterium]
MKAKISKEEVNRMPVGTFEGKITLIEDELEVAAAIEELRKYPVVGIDTETRPSFTRGIHHKVALLQISSFNHCFLFRLNKIERSEKLFDFLANADVKKVGLSLRDDISGLSRRLLFKPQNFIDIQNIAQNYGILELSLQKIYAIVFGKKISKTQRLTNWENDELSEAQQIYAATDAWACLCIYSELQSKEKLTQKQLAELLEEQANELASKQIMQINER